MKDKLLTFEKWLSKIIMFICGAAVIAGTLLVFTITVARYAFGTSWEWAEEMSRYLVLLAALVGSGPMVFKGSHISMDLLVDKIQNKIIRSLHKIFSASCVLVLSALMLKWGMHLVSVTRMKSASLIFQMKMVYSMIPFAVAIMALYCILRIAVTVFEMIEHKRGEKQL